MKKVELKNGMYVKLRNESICIVLYDQYLLVDVKTGKYVLLRSYDDNLKNINNHYDLDIILVYDDYKMDVVLWETPKELLSLEEKEWIQSFIKPFKDMVKYVVKCSSSDEYFIEIILIEIDSDIILPYINNMSLKFEGLELGKKYTLKKLGLDD